MTRAKRVARLGALDRWRDELRLGKRGEMNRPATWVLDNLWSAACKEAVALRLIEEGDLGGAQEYIDWAVLCLAGHQEQPRTPKGRVHLQQLIAGTRPTVAQVVARHQ
jgi:hypothetical protein